MLWEELRAIQGTQQRPWLTTGDHNTILLAQDRHCGSHVHVVEVRDCNDYLFDTGIVVM